MHPTHNNSIQKPCVFFILDFYMYEIEENYSNISFTNIFFTNVCMTSSADVKFWKSHLLLVVQGDYF